LEIAANGTCITPQRGKRRRVLARSFEAIACQQLERPRLVREDVNGPRLDFGDHALVEVIDSIRHNGMLANTLTLREGLR